MGLPRSRWSLAVTRPWGEHVSPQTFMPMGAPKAQHQKKCLDKRGALHVEATESAPMYGLQTLDAWTWKPPVGRDSAHEVHPVKRSFPSSCPSMSYVTPIGKCPVHNRRNTSSDCCCGRPTFVARMGTHPHHLQYTEPTGPVCVAQDTGCEGRG